MSSQLQPLRMAVHSHASGCLAHQAMRSHGTEHLGAEGGQRTWGGGEAGCPEAWAVTYQGCRPMAPISQLILVHWMAVHWLPSTRPPVSPELAFQDQKQIP